MDEELKSISPSLHAIQSIKGETPKDKYKELHNIAKEIVKNDNERANFTKTRYTNRVEPNLLPYLQILIGNELKLNDSVIEALKYNNVMIIKQALNAEWFFHHSNDLININYFVENIISQVSVRTQIELIKTLGNCLIENPQKAESFFTCFADLYGYELALPIIIACSEKFIFDEILKRCMALPTRILKVLYRTYPDLVIRYLQLGNEKNENNKEDRKKHKIQLRDYINFLPVLIKRHTQTFTELFEQVHNYVGTNLEIGKLRTEFFLKNATNTLIEKPSIFLKILSKKTVREKLTAKQFEMMFRNLFPKNEQEIYLPNILSAFDYYKEKNKIELLQNQFRLLYDKDFLTIIIDREKYWYMSEIFKILPADMKEKVGRKCLVALNGSSEYDDQIHILPVKESIPLLKEKLEKPSDKSRDFWIRQMFLSCAMYESKEYLLETLHYYNKRHKNERPEILSEILNTIFREFDDTFLQKEHWLVLRDIIQRSYVKGDLFVIDNNVCALVFENALIYFLKESKEVNVSNEDKIFFDKLVNMVIEGYLEHKVKWDFIEKFSDIDKDYLLKILTAIPQKYPMNHLVWNKLSNKLNITMKLVQGMYNYNNKNSNNKISNYTFTIKNYPWLMELTKEILKIDPCTMKRKKRIFLKDFKKLLLKIDAEWYQNLINEDPNLINDVTSNDAAMLLQNDPKRILSKWDIYLKKCKENLLLRCKITKQFVYATKWHQSIPIKFLEACKSNDPQEKSNYLILGILLEGKEYSRVVEPYLPNKKKLEINDDDAKLRYELTYCLLKAMQFTHPPVPFDCIIPFCDGDYAQLAVQILPSIAQRVAVDKVLSFAYKLVNVSNITIKKLGLRLIFQVATKSESSEFLTRTWKTESDLSVREVMAKIIFNVFKQTPNNETWKLMKICIDELTSDDKTILKFLTLVKLVDKSFAAMYTQEFLNKIDVLNKDDLDKATYKNLICSLAENLDDNILNILPENLITNIVKRNFFKYNDSFLYDNYLLSNENKFEERLKTIIEIVKNEIQNFNTPHPKCSRIYPSKKRLQNFFRELIGYLESNKTKFASKIVEHMLIIFSSIIKPCQDPKNYVQLRICKCFFEMNTLTEFGEELGKQLKSIVKELSTETIIRDIASSLNYLRNQTDHFQSDFDLDVIEGMMKSDDYYGSMVGMNLINKFNIEIYDERLDKLIEAWRTNPSPAIQTEYSLFINETGSFSMDSILENDM